MFLHGNLMHIAFNMIVFVSLGSYVENYIGSKRFLIYYLFCGVISAVIFLAVSNKNDVALIGASGAIFGMITLFMFYFPNEKLYVFFIPIGIKAKYLIPVMIGIEVVSSIFFSVSEVAHLGHVGGVVGGVIIFVVNKLRKV